MRRSPEEKIFEARDDRLEEVEDGLYEELVAPKKKKVVGDLNNFSDGYSPEEITADKEKISRLAAAFRGEEIRDKTAATRKRRGELFEAVVNNGISHGWLGKNTEVIIPSRYDDIINGVDNIVRFKERRGKQYLALAVDITKSEKDMWEKFAAIKESIGKGALTRLKYASPELRGRPLPKVIIGADQKTMIGADPETGESTGVAHFMLQLIRMEAEVKREKEAGREAPQYLAPRIAEAKKKIEHHPIKFKILFEIQAQLQAFRDYAARVNQPKAKEAYEEVLAIINGTIENLGQREEWSNIENDEAAIDGDNVCRMILLNARKVGGAEE